MKRKQRNIFLILATIAWAFTYIHLKSHIRNLNLTEGTIFVQAQE